MGPQIERTAQTTVWERFRPNAVGAMAPFELIDASPASVVSGAVDTRTALRLANQLATYAALSMVMPVPMMVPSFSGITDAQCGEDRCLKACQC